jgi:predicted nuclease of restriction endonuclease-like (RecB) superfamily
MILMKKKLPKSDISKESFLLRPLLQDIKDLIMEARTTVAVAVNATLTMLYWRIGQRIHYEVLEEERADYGQKIVSTLSRQLVREFGRGFSAKNLRHMIRFAEAFPAEEIVSTLWRELSWSHFKSLIYLKDPLQQEFYTQMCRLERWSVRTLRSKIDSMLFERTSISKKPDSLIKQELADLRDQDKLTPDLVFRDPYVLDFLNLQDTFSERDLEAAILRELESFLLELGCGFSFIARQKRIVIDNEDHYMDLLFYNRRLKRLVAIELKLGKFKAAHKGQMELYLRWLEKHETEPGEADPLGLILCTEGAHETIELLQLGDSGIHMAEYLTELPPKEVLEKKLHAAMENARELLDHREM